MSNENPKGEKRKRKYPIKDIKILYSKASRKCSKCRKDIILDATHNDPPAQIGKISHIVAHSSIGPRGDPDYPEEALDKYENWILLCGTCHDEVDNHEMTYPIETLREMKENHERWVKKQLDKGMVEFGFPELKIAIRNINSGRYSSIELPEDLDGISITKKIQKNHLSDEIRGLITSGIFRTKEVRDFFVEIEKADEQFSDEIKRNFKGKYLELKNQDLDEDTIFYYMLEFAQSGTTKPSEEAAALAILCYLFELCEVFEK